jgi:hypothetical protein
MFQTLERQWFYENSIEYIKRKRLLLFKTFFSDCHKRTSSEKAKMILDDYKTNSISLENRVNQNNFANDLKFLNF